jgi:hypothetical protein
VSHEPEPETREPGNDERASLGSAANVGAGDEQTAAADVRDTWNVDVKEWDRSPSDTDPFGDIGEEDVDEDRGSYPRQAGL